MGNRFNAEEKQWTKLEDAVSGYHPEYRLKTFKNEMVNAKIKQLDIQKVKGSCLKTYASLLHVFVFHALSYDDEWSDTDITEMCRTFVSFSDTYRIDDWVSTSQYNLIVTPNGKTYPTDKETSYYITDALINGQQTIYGILVEVYNLMVKNGNRYMEFKEQCDETKNIALLLLKELYPEKELKFEEFTENSKLLVY